MVTHNRGAIKNGIKFFDNSPIQWRVGMSEQDESDGWPHEQKG
jgi:hypothetical protein